MTEPIDQATVPLFPTKDTLLRLANFDDGVWDKSESSVLYRFVDGLVGDAGVGTLKKNLLLSQLNNSLDTTYFSDLDNVFGNLLRIQRLASETYQYNPYTDLLTADEQSEIAVKDAWYRARIKNFFSALNLGGTPDGARMMVKAMLGCDSEIYELWRFQDHYGEIYNISDMSTVTNYMIDPSNEFNDGSNNSYNWFLGLHGSGAVAGLVTTPSAAIHSGTYALKWDTGNTGGVTGTTVQCGVNGISPKMIMLQASKTYNFSFYYYCPTASNPGTNNLNIVVQNYNANNTPTSSPISSQITCVNNTLTRFSSPFTTDSDTKYVVITLMRLDGPTTSKPIYFDDFQITGGSGLQNYFDGTTTGYRWLGTPYQSASTIAGPIDQLSRLGGHVTSRDEIIIYPHKQTISPLEMIQTRRALKRLMPINSIVTVTNTGYAANIPVGIQTTATDTYSYIVENTVTGLPQNILTPDEEKNGSLRWLVNGVPALAPTYVFNSPEEYSEYYLYNNGSSSLIDSAHYLSQVDDQSQYGFVENNYTTVNDTLDAYSGWITIGKADSPDNYPGGQNGKTPTKAPALQKNGQKYVFKYKSQADYVAQITSTILELGGQISYNQYRYPVKAITTVSKVWKPEAAISTTIPAKTSTVTSSWTSTQTVSLGE